MSLARTFQSIIESLAFMSFSQFALNIGLVKLIAVDTSPGVGQRRTTALFKDVFEVF